ncbi:MAG: RNA pseudouridine synthase [Tissierellales bacterium]|jgi:23S rRNA pseudouridine1911/1915/1917 synthase|nr:RNA pseudouridine synthase [Tissierellales bacterium]
MQIPIIYEDKHIVIVNKPINMPTQSDPSGDVDLFSALKKQYSKNQYIGLHHRLDRPVGGCVLFTKTKEVNKSIAKQIQNHSIRKYYLCIVCGCPDESKGSIKQYLKKLNTKNKSTITTESDTQGKLAMLDYEVIETISTSSYGTLSLLKIHLKTGRHHQIRVQLSSVNLPILGDNKYNSILKTQNTICLFSHALSVYHPFKKDFISAKTIPDTLATPWNLFSDSLKKQIDS